MDLMLTITAIATLGGLALLLAVLLAMADRKLYVFEDPRIDQVEDMLPHANCGACGFPGCRPFAEALVQGKSEPSGCTVSSEDGRSAIAAFLGVEAGSAARRVARLACGGAINVSRQQADYRGYPSCRAAALVSLGGKSCSWGCLGFGDCVYVCDFDALQLNPFNLPVVDENACTACGACVEICPKHLFSLEPVEHRLWVACKSKAAGDEVLAVCEVGCTACARCASDAPGDLVTMKNNLPVVNPGANQPSRTPTLRCPTGAILWMDPRKRAAERRRQSPRNPYNAAARGFSGLSQT